MSINVEVIARKGESFESLLNRFRKAVDEEGVLKDYKLNSMMTKKERKKFKEFAADRRYKKKMKRVNDALKKAV